VGKSELAVEVALRCNAEIVGADAFQVYAGFEVLTAAPGADLRAKARHHLVGEIPPAEKFDVARYRELALERIREIEARGKRALIVGGTGLYAAALARGLTEMPAGDPGLREGLERLALDQLQARYTALDPAGAARIDLQNRRRLVRAIEVTLLAGRPFSELRADWSGQPESGPLPGVALQRDREELYRRIDARVPEMLASGAVEEVQNAEPGPTAAQAIGYAEVKSMLRGEMNAEQCAAAIQLRTRRYAKRQLTWLRGENIFFTINLTHKSQSEAAEAITRQLLAGPDGGR
jgi:tRNA dimethylallyltransferase